ncbi:hypothetical protein YC2023_093888 [Brassica napus]
MDVQMCYISELYKRDVHLTSGCYRAHCNWFVHVNRHIALGGAITQSIFFFWNSKQHHRFGGCDHSYVYVWWGSDHANTVQWGGKVLYCNTSDKNTPEHPLCLTPILKHKSYPLIIFRCLSALSVMDIADFSKPILEIIQLIQDRLPKEKHICGMMHIM